MVGHIARFAGLTALLATFVAAPAHAAQVHVGVQFGVPAPVVVAPPPAVVYGGPVVAGPAVVPPYGYVWQPGYFVVTSFGRRHWVPGAWVRRAPIVPRGYVYGYRHGWRR